MFAMMEMKIVLAAFLRRYTITTEVSTEDFEKSLQGKIVLYYADGVQIKIRKRRQEANC